MTVITSRRISTDEHQGQVLLETAGTTRVTIDSNGAVNFAADATGATIKGVVGGTASITAASAATAGSTSGLTGFTIAHGLVTTPTTFVVQPANTKAALASLLGAYVTADGTNVYYNTTSAVTAASAYSFNWLAHP